MTDGKTAILTFILCVISLVLSLLSLKDLGEIDAFALNGYPIYLGGCVIGSITAMVDVTEQWWYEYSIPPGKLKKLLSYGTCIWLFVIGTEMFKKSGLLLGTYLYLLIMVVISVIGLHCGVMDTYKSKGSGSLP